jgi:hypothetical protein
MSDQEISVDALIDRARHAVRTMGEHNPTKRLVVQLACGLREVAMRLDGERQIVSDLLVQLEVLFALPALGEASSDLQAAVARARAAYDQLHVPAPTTDVLNPHVLVH